MKYKPYPKYKDSGVEWLGEIPEHWGLYRLKYTVKLINIKVNASEIGLQYIGLENIESYTGKRVHSDDDYESEGQASLFYSGDVLFCKLRPYLAKAYAAEMDGVCTSELLILRPKNVKQKFLLNYILNPAFISIVDSSTYGAKMPRANWDFISNIPVLVPPQRNDQTLIEIFLDRETTRIDTLIEKKERQIELLKEKRAALISHAVTKGLDPNVKMKDSGVEWLGEVPEHWEVKKIKHISSKIGSGKTPKGGSEIYVETGIMLIRSQNIHFDGLHLEDVAYITEEIESQMINTRITPSDILLNITGASLGRACIVPVDMPTSNVNQHVCIIRPIINEIYPNYLFLIVCSKYIQDQIFSNETGTSREGLNFQQIGNMTVVLPPINEQISIASYSLIKMQKYYNIIDKISKSIELLNEYRTALISAAVTGKIDVREAV